MGRLGYGAGRYRQLRGAGGAASEAPVVRPAATWTGAPSSGFATVPQDPARVTAKPAMRLIVPPRQAFTDELLVGVYAGANYKGSLLDNMGLEKVVAHYEGAATQIAQPSFQTFDDANGNPVTYFGWWVRLKHNGTSGIANLYFEAVPKDATMQSRVTGPHAFLPQAELYDIELAVAASQPEIAGTRYQTFAKALERVYTGGFKRPRITFTEAYRGPMGAIFYLARMDSYCTVEATAPVTFRHAEFTTDNASTFRPKLGDFCFRGANITFDFANTVLFYTEAGHRLWLDGVRVINSAGLTRLLRKGPPLMGALFREYPWITECSFADNHNPTNVTSLVRGTTVTNSRFFRFRCATRPCCVSPRWRWC